MAHAWDVGSETKEENKKLKTNLARFIF